MSSPVTLAASFAIKTWLAAALIAGLFIGAQIVQTRHLSTERQNREKAAATIDCSRFEQGFYDDVNDPVLSLAITNTVRKANHSYSWMALRRADVRDGIARVLKREAHNDLLVVSALRLNPNELADLRRFGEASGCKRLLVVGQYCSGPNVVLFDCTYARHRKA
jgi:hypothetical protein